MDDLINALKLLANQQKDGDSPVKMVVTGLWKKSRLRIMDGLFKYPTVKIGDLEKKQSAREW